jgi:4-amino-4-deoxy-L-arabinose transferase-like glycosyltransferase
LVAARRSGLWVVLGVVVLVRLLFLGQAITGDDVYFLASAEHAQIDPLHPNHTPYVFQGKDVDFRGFPHPPLNAWALAGLLASFGDVRETSFHAFYISFSVMAAWAMWVLARRFSPHPLWAALLFVAAPVFVINGNSFEADVPLTAFWLAGIAAFVTALDRRNVWWLAGSAVLLGLASLTAVQALFVIPILAIYVWMKARDWRAAWAATLSAALVLGAWQLFEYQSIGQFPLLFTAGYVKSYDLAKWKLKLDNAIGLSVHACFLVFPLLLPPAAWLLWRRRDRDAWFLLAWIGIFFAGALAAFYSGSARYLLPIAAPVALLVSRLDVKWLAPAFAAQLTLSLLLAAANYQHWGGYRDFARSLAQETKSRRTWANAEWGLRWYLEENGARPVHDHERIPPGDMVVSSELAYPTPYNRGGSALANVARREIRPSLPFRLIGLDSHSGYSTAEKGFLPFGISTGPIDRVHADVLVEKKPTLEYLPMNAPEAEEQIISGIYGLDGNAWRWTAGTFTVALKPPAKPEPLHVEYFIHQASPTRTLKVMDGDRVVFSQTVEKPGAYEFDTPPIQAGVVTVIADKPFFAPGDPRELGIILTGIGYRK